MDIIELESDVADSFDTACNTYFVSDLHLDPEKQDTIALSLRFFRHVQGAQALFVIGDLFEYWLGDDGADPRLCAVYGAITDVSRSGTAVHLMHGNRDFLLGEQFANRVEATLHSDDHVQVDFGVACFSLLHGDTLCTDDVDYLRLRAMVRDKQWQSNFLGLSIDERITQAQSLREKSRVAVSTKQVGIMDVNEDAVRDHFARFPKNTLIHGHTHRPFDHKHASDSSSINTSKSSASHRRIVLGDWKPDHAMIARFDGQTLWFERFE